MFNTSLERFIKQVEALKRERLAFGRAETLAAAALIACGAPRAAAAAHLKREAKASGLRKAS